MGSATALRQVLKGLCHGAPWKYAVFWKLKQMELSLEDSYFDNVKPGGFLCGKPRIISFACKPDPQNENPVDCLIEMAVASLSCYSYSLGQGIVGNVALKRKHHWTFIGETGTTLQEEFPEEWNQQRIAGIKTILLVPVIPLGVVQLGSLDMVLEDFKEVSRVIDYFGTIQETSGTCISLSSKIMARPDSNESLDMPPVDLPLPLDVIGPILGADTGPFTDENKWQSALYNLFTDHCEDTSVLDMFTDHITDGGISASCLSDERIVTSFISHKHPTIPDPYIDLANKSDHDLRNEFYEETNSIIDNEYLSFPFDSELHKALGISPNGHDDFMQNFGLKADEWTNSKVDTWANATTFCQMKWPEVCSPLFEDSNACFPEERETEQLLDAVITTLLNTSDDSDSSESISRCLRSCSNSSSRCSDSCLTQCKAEDDNLDLGESMSHKRFIFASEVEDFTNCLTRSSVKTVSNVSLGSGQEDVGFGQNKRVQKATNVSRKKDNAADIRKPKPRDRQLIQDRIKELRDLIPDGSKCSIDALLDRTIKHMLFLQSVPPQAEKLKQSAQMKIKGETWNSSSHNTGDSGASWAYEFACGSEQCPLVVEDLDCPGQMLVEMQCKDYEFFLDIAQVLKRLKLNILKGILHMKSKVPWAHFIVETPKGFHRMEILWPMVQLLQQNNESMARLY